MVEVNFLSVSYKIVSPLFQNAYKPIYASAGAAGMDLRACISDEAVLLPGERLRIPTGIALQWHRRDVVGLVYARSGLAWRHGLGLPNGVGVIDSDYTGELQVLLCNFGQNRVVIQPGDRIAQIVFTPIFVAQLHEVSELATTKRGDNGFGSTGIQD